MKTTISDFIIGRNVRLKTTPIRILPPIVPSHFTGIEIYLVHPK